MKKVLTALMCMAFVLGCAFVVKADDAADLAALKTQMAEMQKKIADLEAKQAAAAAAPAAGGAILPNGFKIGGYFRARYENSEAEKSNFQTTEMAFEPKWDSADNKMHAETHLWFYPNNNVYLESAMITVDGLGFGKGSKMIFGKNRSWTYGITPAGANRLTSNYSLYAYAINMDRTVGIQSLNKLDNGKIDLNVSLTNGYTVGTRAPGIALFSGNSTANYAASANPWMGSTQVLANREGATPSLDNNNNKAVSARLGGNVTPQLNIGLSGYVQKLSDADVSLTAVSNSVFAVTGFTPLNKNHKMAGIDFWYKNGPWQWQTQYSLVNLAGLKYDAYQTILGYNIDSNNMVYVNYNGLNYKIEDKVAAATLASKSGGWDKDQLILSYKHMLNKKAWLQVEREFNFEDLPAGTTNSAGEPISKVDNDVTYIEYFISM